MKILALDTSRKVSEVSVYDTETRATVTEMCMEKNNESLLFMISEAVTKAGIRLSDIDAYAACIGPGSFTGLRIGLTTVKTFSQMTGKPVYGMSTFAAMARTVGFSGWLLLDARGGRVYYEEIDEMGRPKYGAQTGHLKALIEEGIQNSVLLIESKLVEEALRGAGIEYRALPADVRLTPTIAQYAQECFEGGQRPAWEVLMPEYVGVSQAERELEEKRCKR